jgi:hypothetical protein
MIDRFGREQLSAAGYAPRKTDPVELLRMLPPISSDSGYSGGSPRAERDSWG